MRRRDGVASLLGQEIEILMRERQRLLQVVGATAALIASLDTRDLPAASVRAADIVASAINALSDESLRDALAAAHARIEDEYAVTG
ncbi:MAG: hypothetical protein AW12_00886 [Candidatus Accumulibacter sp. BA-94]|uniref:hypothetical protein n=1 Tax=Accumulibacter sp. TaxID=2053492 RepID=UPI000449B0FF|nr:hypothetical protein [Accumulibacter sp.]EXI92045.1 MAG: hypothetical protein AW12_00886 [Candidatus Accumulibacter sp. BA-94]HRD86929.1 hypothetical protein [Accumulibacter sp.]